MSSCCSLQGHQFTAPQHLFAPRQPPYTADQVKELEQRISNLAAMATQAAIVMHDTPVDSQQNLQACADYKYARSQLDTLSKDLERHVQEVQASIDQSSPDVLAPLQDQLHWLNEQDGRIKQVLTDTQGWRDPDKIRAGETLVTGPLPPPTPEKKVFTPEQIRTDLKNGIADAGRVAGSNETVNDPLRPLAKQDPVAYAVAKLIGDNPQQPEYQQAVMGMVGEVRQDYTVTEVRRHMTRNPSDIDGALDILKNSLDATATREERQALFEAAGAPYFNRAFFERKIDKLVDPLSTPNDFAENEAEFYRNQSYADNVGKWLQDFASHAPPEALGTALDTVQAKFSKDWYRCPFQGMQVEAGRDFFKGLSRAVEDADALHLDPGRTESHAQAIARWLIDSSDKGAGMMIMLRNSPTTDPRFDSVQETIGRGYGAQLSVAIANQLPKDDPMGMRPALLDSMTAGLGDLQGSVGKTIGQAGEARSELSFFLGNFADQDDEKGMQQMVQSYRSAHPDKANDMDRTSVEIGDRGLEMQHALNAVLNLKISNASSPTVEEKGLSDQLKRIDGDKSVQSAIELSRPLQLELTNEAKFELPMAQGPLTASGVDQYVEKLEHTLPEAGLSQKAAGDVMAQTRDWASDVKAKLAGSVSGTDIDARHREYLSALQRILNGQSGAAQSRLQDVVYSSIPTQHSSLYFMNWDAYLVRDVRNLLNIQAKMVYAGTVNAVRIRAGLGSERGAMTTWVLQRMERLAPMYGVTKGSIGSIREATHTWMADTYDALSRNASKTEIDAIKERYDSAIHQFSPADPRHAFGSAMQGIAAAAFLTNTVADWEAIRNGTATPSTYAYLVTQAAGMVKDSAEMVTGLLGKDVQKTLLGKLNGPFVIASIIPDALWAVDDFKAGNNVAGTAGLAMVGGDAMMIAGVLAGSGPLGWAGFAVMALAEIFKVGFLWWQDVERSNRYEPDHNATIYGMVKELGFTDDQAHALLNQTKNGVSAMQALNQLAKWKHVPHDQLINFLKGLKPGQISELVGESHQLIDRRLGENGMLPATADDRTDTLAGQVTRGSKIVEPLKPTVPVTTPGRVPTPPPLTTSPSPPVAQSTTSIPRTPTIAPPETPELAQLPVMNHAESLRGLDNWMKRKGMELKLQPKAEPSPAPQQSPKPMAPATVPVPQDSTFCKAAADSHLTPQELLDRNPAFNPGWLDAPCFLDDHDGGVMRKYR